MKAKLEMRSMPQRKKILPLVMVLANKIMEELGFAQKINETVEWEESHWNISPGHLAKMLVLSTFVDLRMTLTHLDDRFENVDISYFVGDDAKSDWVNSSNAGRALERIGKSDHNKTYESLALAAIQKYQIPTTRLHSDTTTVSFYGEYDYSELDLTEEEKKELIQIERGYNKDGRPQCNQVVVGQIANEAGIPIVNRVMDGSTSDIEWNKKAVEYFRELKEVGFSEGIYVADSKLVTEEIVTNMCTPGQQIHFVSRCPASFSKKLESRMIHKAYEVDQWVEIGTFHQGKKASIYKGISFNESVFGYTLRLLVLESSSLVAAAEQSLAKEDEELKPLLLELKKKQFLCLADAGEEVARFKTTHKSKLKRFDCTYEIQEETLETWPAGRRGPNTQPKRKNSYRIVATAIRNEAACLEHLHNESCIVLISNVIENVDDRALLQIYKGQQVVENSFRMLKNPCLASVIYLKNAVRIKALTMIMTFSLLLRAIIQHKLRVGLKDFKDKNPGIKLHVGWGNRPLENPTFNLLYEHAIHCCFERESQGCYSFAWLSVETKQRVAPLLDLMGYTLEELL